MTSAKEDAKKRALANRVNARKSKEKLEPLIQKLLAGDINALSQAITIIESTSIADKALANEIINQCVVHSGKSFRLGITGVPGVGKSSFIERFGLLAINKGYKVAVLAVDPSSGINHGSILGDKTRMNDLSVHPKAFIRPSPAAKSLGGVANKTREAMLLCEAAGFDFIMIETVGVGQSETAVKNMCDYFLLLMLSGAGDELQGIKRGIMEMADALIITKADGDNAHNAKLAAQEYRRALHLFPPKKHGAVYINVCSALNGEGLDNIFENLENFRAEQKNHISVLRKTQNKNWFSEYLHQLWADKLHSEIGQNKMNEYLELVSKNQASPRQLAQDILRKFS